MPPTRMRDQKSNLKNSHSTIKGSCSLDFVIQNYIEKRDKYDALKIKYDKSKVFEEQKIQLKKDYDDKLNIIAARNKSIENLSSKIKKLEKGFEKDKKEFHIDMENEMKKSCKLEKELEYMKTHTVSKDDYERRDSYAKKMDEINIKQNKKIEELSEQVNSTKINSLEHLKNDIRLKNENMKRYKEEIKYRQSVEAKLTKEKNDIQKKLDYLLDKENKLTNDYFGFMGVNKKLVAENETLKEEIEKLNGYREVNLNARDKLKEHITSLKEQIETLKEEKEVFIKTIHKFKEYSALMFDLETPLVDD